VVTFLTTLYGISNCDAVKKSRRWLLQNNITYTFHDYRKDGLDLALIQTFLKSITWTELLNKRSTSYRQLTDLQKETLNEENAIALFIEFPTLIKRPLLIKEHHSQLGFKADTYKTIFANVETNSICRS
jgi:Spx/MgsR family transcriptional regulator